MAAAVVRRRAAETFPVATGSDDAEQSGTSVSVNGSDLELVVDGSTVQTVGVRFASVTIPKHAVVTAAWIQFVSDESQSIATSLRIEGQAADNAHVHDRASNISARPRTPEFVTGTRRRVWQR